MRLLLMIVLSLLTFAVMMGSRIAISLATLKLTGSTATTGALVGLNSVMPIVLGLFVGRLIDRFGLLRPMYVSIVISLAGTLLPFVFPSVWALAVASASSGLSFLVGAMALTNAGAMIGEVRDRTRNLSWIYMGNSAGMAVGPLLAGFGIDHISHRGTFLLLAALPALSLLLLTVAGRMIPGRSGTGKAPSGHLMDFLREPAIRSLLLSQVIVSGCLESFYFMVPLHGTRVGISASMIGVIISCAFVANFATRSLMPMLLRQTSEANLVAAVLVIAGLSIAPFGLFANPVILMAMAGGVGICHGMAVPIMTSIIFTASPAGRQGEISGVRAVLTNTTIGMTQLSAGALSSVVGIAPVLSLMGAVALGGSWFVRKHVRVPVAAA